MPQPLGTVTFLFTDIEGSTRLWESHPDEMAVALARHDEILRDVVSEHGGHVFTTAGDSFAVAFARAEDAVRAVVAAQRRLADEPWPDATPVRVRMGLHTGEAQERDGDYFGSAVSRAARLMSAAHGEQVVISASTHSVLGDTRTTGVDLVDLGVHRLKDVAESVHVFQVGADGLRSEFPNLRTQRAAAGNLPQFGESLVGRDADVVALRRLVAAHRLVTVVGVGGIGKTRTALELADTLTGLYPDGVWFCELASVGEPEAVAHVVGQVLGVRQHPGRTLVDSIAEFSRDRRMMLVVDNCEHVLDAAADLIDTVVAASAGSSVVATSREALGCRGEQAYPLRSLDFSSVDSAGVALFLRRAAEVVPRREWTNDELNTVGRICARLDGMPLAIELAASRTRSLHPNEIEERLDESFRVLRGGRRAVERHRTLEAAIDWSHEALGATERAVFARASVFAGGFDLAAAEHVCADGDLVDRHAIVDLLDDLVAKSLFVVDTSASGHARYRLLEPLRQYGEDRLAASGEVEATRSRHLRYFTEWVESWNSETPDEGAEWLLRVRREFANLRAAVVWARAISDVEQGTRIIASMAPVQQLLLLFEIGDWAEAVLDLPRVGEERLGPDVAGVAAMSQWWRSDFTKFAHFAQLGAAMPAADPSRFYPTATEALLLLMAGNRAEAADLLGRVDATDQRDAVLRAYLRLSVNPLASTAVTDLETLHIAAERAKSPLISVMYQTAASLVAYFQERHTQAADAARSAVAIAARMGAPFYVHFNVPRMVGAAAALGMPSIDDLDLVKISLTEQRDAGQELDQWLLLNGMAKALFRYGRVELAVEIDHGWQSCPWAQMHPGASLLAGLHDPSDDPALAATTPLNLEELVNQVLDAINEIIDENRR